MSAPVREHPRTIRSEAGSYSRRDDAVVAELSEIRALLERLVELGERHG